MASARIYNLPTAIAAVRESAALPRNATDAEWCVAMSLYTRRMAQALRPLPEPEAPPRPAPTGWETLTNVR